MARNKYVKDYRLVEYVDERGRIKTNYEYIGDYYRFTFPEKAESAKKTSLIACIGAWVMFIAAVIAPSSAAHRLYAILPLAFSLIPLWSLSELSVSVLKLKDSFEHRFADKLENSYPLAAVFLAILSGIALVGAAVGLIIDFSAFQFGDVLFIAGSGVMCAAGLLAFSLRASFRPEKIH